MRVSIHQAKTQLSKLIAAAERGEEVIISRRETPVVKIVPVQQPKKRVFGALKGKIDIGPEFFDPLPEEELALWNSE
ncbi:MAG: type II toxin-antitoxin system Phd/YefM family antitoxin [Methylobacteriaceae bacterium]|nr:type II toxin-antitoxin system Phd/YefM family antitoxin [Methylobacteriaceae bacterium]